MHQNEDAELKVDAHKPANLHLRWWPQVLRTRSRSFVRPDSEKMSRAALSFNEVVDLIYYNE